LTEKKRLVDCPVADFLQLPSLDIRRRLVLVRRIHDIEPFKCRIGQMPRNLHGDPPWNPGPVQTQRTTAVDVVNKQALILSNFATCLHNQSYLNARSLKRLSRDLRELLASNTLPLRGSFLRISLVQTGRGSRIGSSFLVWLPSIRSWNLPSLKKVKKFIVFLPLLKFAKPAEIVDKTLPSQLNSLGESRS
jgi:hypothetical protein